MAGKKNKKKTSKKKKHPGQPPAGQTILALEDDPQGNTPVSVPTPDPAEKPLAFRFPTPTPMAGQYPLGTASFRFWVAVAALRRGADSWSPGIPGGRHGQHPAGGDPPGTDCCKFLFLGCNGDGAGGQWNQQCLRPRAECSLCSPRHFVSAVGPFVAARLSCRNDGAGSFRIGV
jgi:hypothetical protein